MRYYAPDYYEKFKCTADKCRHSCCIGWEIDVDMDTLALYDILGGEIGDRLQQNIKFDGETAHFVLEGDGRCPFLNESNLCDLIIELGEGSLCDICADHPRFRNFYTDRVEEGLGLSCEEAARLILTNKDKVKLVLTEETGEGPEGDIDELAFIKMRNMAIAIMQNREVPVDMRVMGILTAFEAELSSLSWGYIKNLYLGLERLNEDWTEYLNLMDLVKKPSQDLETAYEQLLVYLIYRNLKQENLQGTAKFCALSYLVIRRICEASGGTINALMDVARRYSSEIEYSDENIEKIIKAI